MSYSLEWTAGPALLGALLLLIVPPFALIALVCVALAAAAALVALTGAVLAMPYLLVRSLRRRLAERPMPNAIAQTGMASKRSGGAVFAEPTTARTSGGE
jgi:positive regulator of sigma E activity